MTTLVSDSTPCNGFKYCSWKSLSGKELTNPPEVSFKLLLVTAMCQFRVKLETDMRNCQ